jgi:type II secretory pathway pseudopilin PulG
MKRHFLSERGDTIVEVLISIAVISLILGGAFVATNRSLTATRDTQERSDGLKLVESQIELLKSQVSTNAAAIFGSPVSPFCIVTATSAVSASNTSDCKMSAAGTPTTVDPKYNIAITRSGNVFTIVNTWDGITGRPAKVEMKYRLYQ